MSLLAACGGGGDEADAAGAIAVKATDDTCEVANTDLPAGKTTFKVTNEGSKVNEFEVLKPDGKILAERENIGPGTSVDFVVNLPAGQYRMLCSAGQTGKGPSQNVTVTGASAGGGDQRLDKAAADYKTFVIARLDDTLAKTRTFVDAVKAATSRRPRSCTRRPASGGRRSSPSPRSSATSTRRSTPARPT